MPADSDTHIRQGYCRICGSLGTVSARGKCPDCSKRRVMENHESLTTKTGSDYERWKKACLRALGKPKRSR